MLKPCPRCGSTNVTMKVLYDKYPKEEILWNVVCHDCGLEGPEYSSIYDSEQAQRLAVEHWNAEAHRGR